MSEKLVNFNSREPLYQQVKDILLSRITEGNWKPGDLIPTETELMEEFQVSRTTIREAISVLVNDGLLQKQQGKGTIVKSLKLTGSLSRLTGFAEQLIERGFEPKAKLLRAEFRNDLFHEKKQLGIPADEKILMIDRIRFADDVPIAVEKTCWPKHVGEVLMKYDLDNAQLYQLLEDNHIYLKRAKEIISAVNATSYEADMLGVSIGSALLEMTRLSYSVDDQPIEYTKTKFRSDLYQYSVELRR